MSEYLKACEAYLGTPSGKVSERRGASASPTPPSSRVKSAGGSSSTARRRRSAGVLVKAPSPVAEIPSKPLIKSARSRRRKKLGEDISTSNSDSDYSVPVSKLITLLLYEYFIFRLYRRTSILLLGTSSTLTYQGE